MKLTVAFLLLFAVALFSIEIGYSQFGIYQPLGAQDWTGTNSERTQHLILQSDGLTALTITRIEYRSHYGAGNTTYSNFTIKLCDTAVTEVTANWVANYGGNTPITVFSRDSIEIETSPLEWFVFDLDEPFVYNGTDNLLVEIEWNGKSGVGINTWGTYSSNPRILTARNGGSLYLYTYLHNLMINRYTAINPTSLGSIKATFK